MTEYMIVKEQEDGDWKPIINAFSSSPRRALASVSLDEGNYIALPKRSWKPLVVKVEQTTKVTIG